MKVISCEGQPPHVEASFSFEQPDMDDDASGRRQSARGSPRRAAADRVDDDIG